MDKSRRVFPDLTKRREDRKLTKADLAKMAGVAKTVIYKAEAGNKVSADTYRWIEEALMS